MYLVAAACVVVLRICSFLLYFLCLGSLCFVMLLPGPLRFPFRFASSVGVAIASCCSLLLVSFPVRSDIIQCGLRLGGRIDDVGNAVFFVCRVLVVILPLPFLSPTSCSSCLIFGGVVRIPLLLSSRGSAFQIVAGQTHFTLFRRLQNLAVAAPGPHKRARFRFGCLDIGCCST